jgi:hypothetical protein
LKPRGGRRTLTPMSRRAGAVILYGGWLLLFNTDRLAPNAPLATWKKLDEYDTAYRCEQERRAAVVTALAEQRAKKRAEPPMLPGDADLRYRCERIERIAPPPRR